MVNRKILEAVDRLSLFYESTLNLESLSFSRNILYAIRELAFKPPDYNGKQSLVVSMKAEYPINDIIKATKSILKELGCDYFKLVKSSHDYINALNSVEFKVRF